MLPKNSYGLSYCWACTEADIGVHRIDTRSTSNHGVTFASGSVSVLLSRSILIPQQILRAFIAALRSAIFKKHVQASRSMLAADSLESSHC